MRAVTTYFFDESRSFRESWWLRKSLAIYIIFKCVYWIVDYSLLFGTDSIIYKKTLSLPIWQKPAFFLFYSDSVALPMIFLGVTFLSALYVLITRNNFRLVFFILWICIININNTIYTTLSAGDYLFQHLLFFSIFLSDGIPKLSPFKKDLDVSLHNTGIIALRLQICIVYFFASAAKLNDDDWMNGTAISTILSVHGFSLPFLYEGNDFLNKCLDYTVLAYQLLFPVLVWVRPIKKWFLLIGVVQHLFIAFFIGLPSFGLIMIVAYAIFYVPFKKT